MGQGQKTLVKSTQKLEELTSNFINKIKKKLSASFDYSLNSLPASVVDDNLGLQFGPRSDPVKCRDSEFLVFMQEFFEKA